MKTTTPATEKAHATYSPSGSPRWLICHGSIALSKKAPPQKSGPWAEEGTKAHSCLEDFFTLQAKGVNIKQSFVQLYKKYNDFTMVDHAGDAFEAIIKMVPAGAEVFAETEIDIGAFTKPGEFGTADAIIVEEFGKLTVIDFKYGAGKVVDVEENTQLILYALGAAHKFDYNFAEVEMVIMQPRAEHKDGFTRSWTITMEELLEWGEKFKAAVKECEKPTAKLTAGDHCYWCPAKTICPEISSKAMARAKVAFEEAPEDGFPIVESVPLASSIPVKQLGVALKNAELLERWVAALRERVEALLENGVDVPGWKLVPKRGTRQWVDEKKAADSLKKMLPSKTAFFTVPELKTPTQIEKLLDELDLNAEMWMKKHTAMVVNGTKLAPCDDDVKQPAEKPITTKKARK